MPRGLLPEISRTNHPHSVLILSSNNSLRQSSDTRPIGFKRSLVPSESLPMDHLLPRITHWYFIQFLVKIFFWNSLRWGLKSLKRLEDLRIGHSFLIPRHYITVNCAHLGTKDSDSWINRWESEILFFRDFKNSKSSISTNHFLRPFFRRNFLAKDNKMGCVSLMVIFHMQLHAGFGRNYHRENTLYFTNFLNNW